MKNAGANEAAHKLINFVIQTAKAKGLTISKHAELAELEKSYVSKIYRGKVFPALPNLTKFVKAAGLEIVLVQPT